jgi:hypothetical protein
MDAGVGVGDGAGSGSEEPPQATRAARKRAAGAKRDERVCTTDKLGTPRADHEPDR